MLHFLDDPGRALAEAARVLKPGGRLVVVDFAPHTLEHLRSEHAHRHLGVSEADFERWASKAGFAVKSAKTFRAPGGDKGVAVTVWTADLQLQKAGKRSAA